MKSSTNPNSRFNFPFPKRSTRQAQTGVPSFRAFIRQVVPLGSRGTILFLLLLTLLSSCKKDEVTQTYSTANRVFVSFSVLSYAELFNAMGNPGQFVSVRSTTRNGVTGVLMTNSAGSHFYQLDKVDLTSFYFGLGGLIMGTNNYGELESLAYDLACPNCNRADTRMDLHSNGTSTCPHCHISYDLNNYGIITNTEGNTIHASPRGLYRYRIMFDGTTVNVYN